MSYEVIRQYKLSVTTNISPLSGYFEYKRSLQEKVSKWLDALKYTKILFQWLVLDKRSDINRGISPQLIMTYRIEFYFYKLLVILRL